MTETQHQNLVMIMFDLESFSHSWECETFTKEHGEALRELADNLGVIVKEIKEDKQ